MRTTYSNWEQINEKYIVFIPNALLKYKQKRLRNPNIEDTFIFYIYQVLKLNLISNNKPKSLINKMIKFKLKVTLVFTKNVLNC